MLWIVGLVMLAAVFVLIAWGDDDSGDDDGWMNPPPV